MKFVSVLVAASLWCGAAQASPITDADARFEEGIALVKQHRPEEAREKFLQSLALERSAPALLNLAILEGSAKRPALALGYLREWLRHPKADAKRRPTVERDLLPALEADTGRLDVAAPDGAEIFIDGVSQGNAPIRAAVDVMPGAHEVSRAGQTVRVVVMAGGRRDVSLLSADTGVAPAAPTRVPIAPPPKAPTQRGSWVLPAVLAGAGVAALGTGVALGVISTGARNDAEKNGASGNCSNPDAPACADIRSAVDKVNATGTGAIVAYAVGGVLLGGALVSALVIAPWKSKSPSVSLLPTLGGAAIVGTF